MNAKSVTLSNTSIIACTRLKKKIEKQLLYTGWPKRMETSGKLVRKAIYQENEFYKSSRGYHLMTLNSTFKEDIFKVI